MDSKLTLYTKPLHFRIILIFIFISLVITNMQSFVENNHSLKDKWSVLYNVLSKIYRKLLLSNYWYFLYKRFFIQTTEESEKNIQINTNLWKIYLKKTFSMDYILKTLNVTIGFYYSIFLILLIRFF